MQGLEIKINVIKRERGKKLQNRPFLSSLILRHSRSFAVPRTSENHDNFWVAPSFCFIAKLKSKAVDLKMTFEECFHMRSCRPYWCPKTMKRQPCWCSKLILSEWNSFLMQTLSFVPMNLWRFWPCEWKHSIPMQIYLVFKRQVSHIVSFGKWEPWNLEMAYVKVFSIFFFVDLIINLVSSDRLIKSSPIKKTHLLCL